MSKVLAVDYGSKRVGVASGESEFAMAFPREVILNTSVNDVVDKIAKLVLDLGVDIVVVGLPLNMNDGHEDNPILLGVNKFFDSLSSRLKDVEVVFLDERLSSFEADQMMEKIKNEVGDSVIGRDAYAACVILQRFFDKQ